MTAYSLEIYFPNLGKFYIFSLVSYTKSKQWNFNQDPIFQTYQHIWFNIFCSSLSWLIMAFTPKFEQTYFSPHFDLKMAVIYSKNYRITEQLKLEVIWSNLPCRDTYRRLPKTMSRQLLKISRKGDSTTTFYSATLLLQHVLDCSFIFDVIFSLRKHCTRQFHINWLKKKQTTTTTKKCYGMYTIMVLVLFI